jgi:hypothetical protein
VEISFGTRRDIWMWWSRAVGVLLPRGRQVSFVSLNNR